MSNPEDDPPYPTPLDPNACRIHDCEQPPKWVGTWQQGLEAGWRIPYCDEHKLGRNGTVWVDVTPWPDRTLEEIEAEFWKELGIK